MSENCEICLSWLSQDPCGVIKLLLGPNKQSKPHKYSIYSDLKQREVANPQKLRPVRVWQLRTQTSSHCAEQKQTVCTLSAILCCHKQLFNGSINHNIHMCSCHREARQGEVTPRRPLLQMSKRKNPAEHFWHFFDSFSYKRCSEHISHSFHFPRRGKLV